MNSDHQIAYVASGQIPPSAPPVSMTGPIGWIRENLFDGPINSLLTLVSIVVIVLLVPPIFDWAFLKGVWNASSLTQCREIIIAAHGEGATGACWAVINERFNQFLFGFYPPELYWRPTIAFILLFVALAPILFTAVPRQMLWFSLAYPVIAFLLIWGLAFSGTYPAKIEIWQIALKLLAVPLAVFGYVVGTNLLKRSHLAQGVEILLAAGVGLALFLIWWLLVSDELFARILLRSLWEGNIEALTPGDIVILEPVESRKLGGFMLALVIGVTGIAASLPIGIVLALGRQSSMFFIKTICVVFIEFIRGVPLITLLFVASVLLNYFLPPGTSFDLILRVVIMVTLFASAYMAEVIRGGLAALPQGQYEAADSLGLNYWKSTRLIIMPQALKVAIPGIVNTFIGLFKDTTLVSVIGLLDPVGLLNPIRANSNWNGITWELYVFVALFFWIFCFSMSRYSMYLERKLKTDR
jgi:general L-amino acid transport system permease protein